MSASDHPSETDAIELVHSPLGREVSQGESSVRIAIYRGSEEEAWQLEVESATGGSTVWEDRFESDRDALDEALRAIEADGIESFAAPQSGGDVAHGWWDEDGASEAISLVKQAMDASDELLGFHTTCGLLAAVVTAPEIVPPSAWLEYVKGEHVFHGLEEIEGFTGGLMQLHNAIARSLEAKDARCVPGPDDEKAIEAFCAGYVTIAANDDTWEANARVFVELLPMFALSGSTSLDKVGELLPSAKQDPEGWLRKAREELPNTVLSMFDVWAGARRAAANRKAQAPAQARREGSKVGRNDPCPCGSGKKYKKCCAN